MKVRNEYGWASLAALTLVVGGSVALTGCSMPLANGMKTSIAPLPAPLAEPGEPPITARGAIFDDGKVYSQHFDTGTVLDVPASGGTIAYRYRLFAGRSAPVPAQSIPVRCSIDDGGEIDLSACTAEGDPNDGQEIALALAMVALQDEGGALPRYRLLPAGYAELNRFASLTLTVPEIRPPNVDLSIGRLVEFAEVDLDPAIIAQSYAYPSRALRSAAEGNLVAECQIQQDRSTICVMKSFDPAEHAGLFLPALDQIARRLRPGALLSDGSDARGVRFPLRIAFRIPG